MQQCNILLYHINLWLWDILHIFKKLQKYSVCCISYKSPYYLHVFTNMEGSIYCNLYFCHEKWAFRVLLSFIKYCYPSWFLKESIYEKPIIKWGVFSMLDFFVTLNIFQTHLTIYFNRHKLLRKWFKLICLKSILDIWIRIIFILKGVIRFALYHMNVFQWPLINSIY